MLSQKATCCSLLMPIGRLSISCDEKPYSAYASTWYSPRTGQISDCVFSKFAWQ
jgi:hypothetical protein